MGTTLPQQNEIHGRGVGEVLEVVRPKVGAAEGRVGGGSWGPPPGKFCKKDTKSCVLGTSGAVCSRVEYSSDYIVVVSVLSTTADA